VVGCGGHATVYQLPALRRCPRATVVALVDSDMAAARRLARRFRAGEPYDNHRALVGRVDAALVATPNGTHRAIAGELLENGIHVLCEKPLCTTSADIEQLLSTAARSGARLMAAHCLRFAPGIAMLQRVVLAGRLGSVREIVGSLGSPYRPAAHRTDFRKDRRLSGGGVLIDLGIHLIDLAIWLVGADPVSACYSAECCGDWPVESDAEVQLEFAPSVTARLACSFTRALDNSLTVRGTEGWARVSLYDPTELTFFGGRSRICQRDGIQRFILSGTGQSMYEHQLLHFCDCVESSRDFLIQPGEVRASMRVVEQCYADGGCIG
jgi:predicted dehydrogenase